MLTIRAIMASLVSYVNFQFILSTFNEELIYYVRIAKQIFLSLFLLAVSFIMSHRTLSIVVQGLC